MPSIDQARAQAVRHYTAGELTQAQALCQQILQASPSDHSTLHLMAVIAVQAGRSDLAEPFLRRSICDPLGDPPAHTEELFRLPRAFCCFTSDRSFTEPNLLPARRAGFVTFGSLHPPPRLNRGVLDTWCNILHAVPGSHLLIFRNTLRGKVRDDVFRYVTERGITPDRLVLAHKPPATGYTGVYHDIDISLDTFPWSGHTTACQSIWMGVPIVTLRGNRYAGRMVASVLHHVGLGHLVAGTREEYVQIAVKLAGDVEGLARLRAGLRQQMSASVMCDRRGFARDLESGYRQMWKKWCGRSGPLSPVLGGEG